MTIRELKPIFEKLCPVVVKYNDEVIFDDDKIDLSDKDYHKMLDEYEYFMNSDKEVKSFNTTIVHFHHSILDIKG